MDSICILSIIGLVALVILIIGIAWLAYMGVFRMMKSEVREISEMTILNYNYTGLMSDYMKGYTDCEKRVSKILPKGTLFAKMGGVYWTDPKDVKNHDDNQWSIFYAIDEKREIMEMLKKLPSTNEYSIITIPKSKVVYTSFPYRNTLSYMFGPMKAYPALRKLLSKLQMKPHGCIELYYDGGKPSEFMFYLEHSEVFDELKSNSTFVAANKL